MNSLHNLRLINSKYKVLFLKLLSVCLQVIAFEHQKWVKVNFAIKLWIFRHLKWFKGHFLKNSTFYRFILSQISLWSSILPILVKKNMNRKSSLPSWASFLLIFLFKGNLNRPKKSINYLKQVYNIREI